MNIEIKKPIHILKRLNINIDKKPEIKNENKYSGLELKRRMKKKYFKLS